MRRFGTLLLVIALVVAGFGVYSLHTVLDYHRYSNDVIEELMYFPSGRFVRMACVGYRGLAADLLWLRSIQYYGEHRRTDQDYPLAEHIFSTITDLDPSFVGAYRFGAFVLAQDVGQPASGVELLRKGMRSNPDLWQLPFDLGFLYFISLKDNAKAAHFFRFASRFDDSPDIAKRFSAFAYKKAGNVNVALSLWEQIYRTSTNRLMKENALLAIRKIKLQQTVSALTGLIERYESEIGTSPSDLHQLVDVRYLRSIPEDPFGGRYFIDEETGTVLSTTQVRNEAEWAADYVRRRVDRFLKDMDRYPDPIGELEREGLIDEVPRVAGTRLIYDSSTGVVRYVPVWGDTR
jgi:tetratricopeptide (TPR) repeat protein